MTPIALANAPLTILPTPCRGGSSGFFLARLALERDFRGVPNQWVEHLPEPVATLDYILPCCGSVDAFLIRGREEERAFSKEGALIGMGDSLVEFDPSSEGLPELPSLEGSPLVTRPESMEAKLLFQCKASLLKVARLQEELEVSQAEVMRLQALLREGDVRSSAVIEYLHSDIYHRREEFEHSHYSQSRYVRALSDVAALYSGIDFSSLYRAP
ncbi:hypothetical protein ACLOJK_036507 [Asimina triloba]